MPHVVFYSIQHSLGVVDVSPCSCEWSVGIYSPKFQKGIEAASHHSLPLAIRMADIIDAVVDRPQGRDAGGMVQISKAFLSSISFDCFIQPPRTL